MTKNARTKFRAKNVLSEMAQKSIYLFAKVALLDRELRLKLLVGDICPLVWQKNEETRTKPIYKPVEWKQQFLPWPRFYIHMPWFQIVS